MSVIKQVKKSFKSAFDFKKPAKIGTEGCRHSPSTTRGQESKKSPCGESERTGSQSEIVDSELVDFDSPSHMEVSGSMYSKTVSPAKTQEQWLADVEYLSSNTKWAEELAIKLADKSKMLSEAQMTLD